MSSSLKLGDRVELETKSLSRGGKAVGRVDGQVVFVVGGAPDEHALVEITKSAKRFAEARIVEVLRASPHRRTPPCPYFQKCGGCPWQHIEYSEQIRQKRNILVETLVRGGALRSLGVTSETAPAMSEEVQTEASFIASSTEWRYRSRITTHVRNDEVGFMKRGTHDFIAIKDCLIAAEGLVEFAKRSTAQAKGGRLPVTQSPTGIRIGSGFTQVHLEQNSRLQTRVVELVLQAPLIPMSANTRVSVLDLYAGNGNFSFPIEAALNGRLDFDLTAVELSPESVADANRIKATCNSRISFVVSDVGRWLQKNPRSAAIADEIVVLDPPRVGCDENVVEALARRKPRSLIYVSCDPNTLARDLNRFRELTSRAGDTYRLRVFQGFDLFPQTDHIEAIVALDRV